MPAPIRWIGSTNKSIGRGGYRPEAVVIHIMEGSLAATDSWFNTTPPTNPMPTSAHYGVGRDGRVHQYVHEGDTAWHAGRVHTPKWRLIKRANGKYVNPNLYTIGIEHEGFRTSEWTDAMYEASGALLAGVARRWSIPLDRDHVVGHGEIYSPKDFCPGRGDLDRLLARACALLVHGGAPNFVASPGETTARTALNIRRGAPTAAAARVRSVTAGSALPYVGWTSAGQTVHGNAHWYRDADGDWFWAGGTEQPIPTTTF